jgi:AraC family transcriptional regulator
LEKLTDWMKRNLAENISLDDMADQIGLSKSHFLAIFKKQMGTGPGKYFRKLRIDQVAQRLRGTATPIKTIAKQLGYPDLSHFYRAFKSHYGLTPMRYREKIRLSDENLWAGKIRGQGTFRVVMGCGFCLLFLSMFRKA